MKFIACFTLAAGMNAVTWWATLFGSGTATISEIIQLGGTGGLIVALLGAVVALWKDRQTTKAELLSEIEALRSLLANERRQHREEIASLRQDAEAKFEAMGLRYTDELKMQIQQLRQETQAQFQNERDASNGKHKTDDQ